MGREASFEKVLNAPVVNTNELQELSREGIPAKYRALSWQILLGYLPVNKSRQASFLRKKRREYSRYMHHFYRELSHPSRMSSQDETLMNQILTDVPRTAPHVSLFTEKRVHSSLARLLYTWAKSNTVSLYVQGIDVVVTPLFSVFLNGYFNGKEPDISKVSDTILAEVEADSYWCLTKLLTRVPGHYTKELSGVIDMISSLQHTLRSLDLELYNYLVQNDIDFHWFAVKWMHCLLVRDFPLHCLFRMWDIYFSLDKANFKTFHVYVCAAYLSYFSSELLNKKSDELIIFIQNMPTHDWTERETVILLNQVFAWHPAFKENIVVPINRSDSAPINSHSAISSEGNAKEEAVRRTTPVPDNAADYAKNLSY